MTIGKATFRVLLCALLALLCGGFFANNNNYQFAEATCIGSNSDIESFFAGQIDAANPPELPTAGSCCQMDICAIPCPATVPKPDDSFGIGVICVVVLFCMIGIGTVYFVGGKAKNFFVAGRSLPLPVVVLTLASQSIDSNALLGLSLIHI